MSLRFKTPKERIPLKGSKKQGLRGNKIRLKGNKRSGEGGARRVKSGGGKALKSKKDFKFLKLGKSSYPSLDDDVFARMARETDEDEDDYNSSDGDSGSGDDFGRSGAGGGKRLQVSTPLRAPVARTSTSTRPAPPMLSDSEDSDLDSDSESESDGMLMPEADSDSDSDGDVPTRSMAVSKSKKSKGHGGSYGGGDNNPFGMDNSLMEEAEKQDILGRLHTLRQRGVRLSKNYTPRSSIQELRMEMGRIEHEEETKRAVMRLRRWLMAGVSGMQWVTSQKFTPKFARGRLNGFSDYVLGSIEDYDPVFESMSERYGGVIGIGSSGNPMLDLFILLGTQMVMFVFLQHQANVKPPTPEEIRKQHPDLVRKAARELAEQMRQDDRAREMEDARRRAEEQQRLIREFQQPLHAMHGTPGSFGGAPMGGAPTGAQSQNPFGAGRTQQILGHTFHHPAPPPMRGPSMDFSGFEAPEPAGAYGSEAQGSGAYEDPGMSPRNEPATRPSLVLNDEGVAAQAKNDPIYDVSRVDPSQSLEDFYAEDSRAAPPEEVASVLDRAALASAVPDDGNDPADLFPGASAMDLPLDPEPAFAQLERGNDTYPRPPEASKMVELPEKSVSTRKGRTVKVTEVPGKGKDGSGPGAKKVLEIA